MILEIDFGNTRLKWRVLDSKSLLVVKSGTESSLEGFSTELRRASYSNVVFARGCSVRNQQENQRLAALISSKYGVELKLAYSQAELAGVKSGYIDPTKLGVDRWLAMLGAYAKVKGACLVIDCGTAITVDYIKANGVHLGGCIAPGIKLMSKTLLGSTNIPAGMAELARQETKANIGRTTQQAIASGVRSMVVGFIADQIQLAKQKLGREVCIVASGGDSELVGEVAADALVDKDLVFSGLAIACPYCA